MLRTEEELDKTKARELFFSALANENRLKVLEVILEQPRSVSEICEELGMEQSLVSHSLRCLSFCGFVSFKREGKRVIYSANEIVKRIFALADEHIAMNAPHLYTCEVLKR